MHVEGTLKSWTLTHLSRMVHNNCGSGHKVRQIDFMNLPWKYSTGRQRFASSSQMYLIPHNMFIKYGYQVTAVWRCRFIPLGNKCPAELWGDNVFILHCFVEFTQIHCLHSLSIPSWAILAHALFPRSGCWLLNASKRQPLVEKVKGTPSKFVNRG